MDLCIYAWGWLDISPQNQAKLIKDAGFSSVMLFWDGEFGNDFINNKPGIFRNAGLRIENVHMPFDDANDLWLDNQAGNKVYEQLLHCINDCGSNKIPIAVMHLTSGDNPPPISEIGINRIKNLLIAAKENGVILACENLRRTDYLDYVFNTIDSDYLKFFYDSGHENIYSKNEDLLAKHGNKLVTMHLHDNDGNDDQHALPFSGTVDYRRIMRHLKRLQFSGALGFELHWQAYDDFKKFSDAEYLSEVIKIASKLLALETPL